ncbi:MAG: HAMP domain-containing protein [Acidobacteriia bacterium]|nr:HAMP domain-containing protein [Terriglobia bacterium]
MTIGKKLYLNFGAILALLLLLFIVNMTVVRREHSARDAASRSLQVTQEDESVRFQIMQNRLHLRNYLLSGDSREVDRMDEGIGRLHSLVKDLQSKVSSEGHRAALQSLDGAERQWESGFARPLVDKRKLVDSGATTVAELQIYYLQLNPTMWMKTSTAFLDEGEAANAKLLEAERKKDEAATKATTIISVVATLLAILLGVFISYRTAKSITDRLRQLIGIARDIGESGDLDHEVDSEREDEIGDLARTFSSMVTYLREMAAVSESIAGGDLAVEVRSRSSRDVLGNAFAKMIEGLRALVSKVRDSAAQVASGSNQVAGASDESAKISLSAASAIDEVTSTMHEMTINVQNMVKNTQVQASSVNETSASIDQMVTSIQRVADTAKVLLDISQRSREEVQNGISTMEKATEGLTRINQSISSSGEIIGALGQRADDIGKIVEVIDDLADQTNLLALNAAIEAARAGEHGLGFAVVADEVRKLAERSAQSTKEIAELIASIQKEARKAVDNMEKSTGIVNEGITLGADLNLALRRISTVVTEVYKFAQEIGAATNEQSHGSSQIARATTRLNEITHEINSAVEEQASGAQGVVNAMERMRELVQRSSSGSTELAASSEQMSKMSRSLLEAMDRFVLDGYNGNGRRPSRPGPVEGRRVAPASYAAAARS